LSFRIVYDKNYENTLILANAMQKNTADTFSEHDADSL